EGRYGLMPGIISALAERSTPLSILTKGTLLRRDLPLLSRVAEDTPVEISMSIAVHDDALQQSLEPGTPTTKARLATVRAAAELGFDVTVFMMPILPKLTESHEHLDSALCAIREAGAARVVYGPLHLRPGAREWFFTWLEHEHPELLPRYHRMYATSAYASTESRRWLAERIDPLIDRYGCADRVMGPLRPNPADEDAVARSPRRPLTPLPRDCPHLPNRPCSEPRTARLDSLRTGTTVCLRTRAGGITSARSQLLLS